MHGRDTVSSSDWDFIAAQTGWDIRENSDVSDWDTRVVSAAGACTSTVDVLRINNLGPGIGRQITELCKLLLNIFSTYDKYVKFLSCRGKVAQDLLDILQKLLDHSPLKPQFKAILYVALVRLCRKSELCPRSFDITGVTDRNSQARWYGAFGDIYEARYKERLVCLKSVKVYREQSSEEEFARKKLLAKKAFYREAVVWGQLSHVNVLPFYGIYFFDDTLCLVSPLIPNGNVNSFLNKSPQANRLRLISGVAAGMHYLHQNGVVHGDLKCLNVLVSQSEQALLTDFGFSYVTDNSGLEGQLLSSTHATGGTPEFEAPERSDDPKKRRDGASDVFAFGMLCYEMFVLPQLQTPIATIHAKIVHRSQFPQRPGNSLTDDLWALMKKCWSHEPKSRPTATEIKQKLSPSSTGDSQFNRRIRPSFEPADVTTALAHLSVF